MRYGAIALAITLVVVLAIWPFATAFVNQWAQRDVEMRSQMLFNAARDQVLSLQGPEDGPRLTVLMERLAEDEGVLAVGLCESGTLRLASSDMPQGFACEQIAVGAGEVFTRADYAGIRAMVAAYPLSAPAEDVRFVILHDYADVEERRSQARIFLLLAAIGVAFGGAALASLVAFWIMRSWTISVRRAIEDAREGRAEDIKHTPTEIGTENPRRAVRARFRPPQHRYGAYRVEPRDPAHRARQRAAGLGGDRRLQPRALYPQSRRERRDDRAAPPLPASSRRLSPSPAPVAAPGSRMARAPVIARRWTATTG